MSIIAPPSRLLFDGEDTKEIDVSSGVTAENMVKNYETVSAWLDKGL